MSERRPAPTVGQVVLGRRLQELREAAGLSREEAARVLRVAPATVRRMETAEVALKIPYVQVLLEAYGVPEAARPRRSSQLAEEANQPGWWQRFHDVLPEWFSLYVSLEGAARHDPLLRAALRAGAAADRGLRAGGHGGRDVGQTGPRPSSGTCRCAWPGSELLEREDPPHLWVIMDETVLRRPVSVRRGDARTAGQAAGVRRAGPGHAPGLPSSRRVRTRGRTRRSRCSVSPSRSCPTWSFTEYLTGALYLDSRQEVSAHLEVLDHMTARAASAQRTKQLLRARGTVTAAPRPVTFRPPQEQTPHDRIRAAPPHPVDTSRPHPARVYDWWLGGKDNYPVDEELARRILAVDGTVMRGARANRRFMQRAVRAGRRGRDPPVPGHRHRHPHRAQPAPGGAGRRPRGEGRVRGQRPDRAAARGGAAARGRPRAPRVRPRRRPRPDTILRPGRRRPWTSAQPVALSLVALTHYCRSDDAYGLLNRYCTAALAPGSSLVLSQVTADLNPEADREGGRELPAQRHALPPPDRSPSSPASSTAWSCSARA